MLTVAILCLAAFAAGVTGAWSPCGFSMVETLAGAAGREGAAGRRLVRASCATFAVGAVLGGALTFGLLALLGSALGAGGTAALVVAAALALSAALADALGVRVAPQIRRQVPEPWRRTLPLPLAAALYGVLLGLGFTTFVLAFAVWALAGISVAVGEPATGLAIGVAFGVGRALPVVLMAPRHDTLGAHLHTRMAEEPRLLRRLRLADAALLAAAAVALVLGPAAASADAARASQTHVHGTPNRFERIATPGGSPSAADGAVAWQASADRARLRAADGAEAELAGRRVALGGSHLAILGIDRIDVTDRASGQPVAAIAAPGADEIAVSGRWVVWRTPGAGDQLFAAALPLPDAPAPPAEAVRIAHVRADAAIGRPSLDGDRVAYAVASPRGSRVVVHDIGTVTRRVAVSSRRTQLADPALLGNRLLYTEARICEQRLLLTSLAPDGRARSGRTIARLGGIAWRDPGHEHGRTTQGNRPTSCPHGSPPRARQMLWSTALDRTAAYVTLLRPAGDAAAVRTTLARIGL